ncbi:Autophagy-related protein 16-1 [Cyphomyrmex costatus]|uniref:Autophagy-related protein 16-1 n=1 Tax=Cyphomyrmex costatus TaxID=456900 RepID=A0A195CFA8_9HYME|nr:Autophagy-related protein 16-1 [Cyphomyrmex costatus]
MAAKFLGEPSKVVTGSYDRTLKIWDLRSKACIETKFAGSSCNDLVTSDGAGSTIISGHFDQRIRFWDTRAESSSNDILLEGKVTSLDLSRDANYLLSCVRDDTVKLIDLRMKKIVGSFSADGFKVGFDWTRAAFSPDGQYIAVGSADGSVFIWSIVTNAIETILKEHTFVHRLSEYGKRKREKSVERDRSAMQRESGIDSNISRPRAFSALSPIRVTLMDALIGGISRGMQYKDRSYYRGAENRCVLNTKNVNYVITAVGTVKHDITCKSIASAVNNFRVSPVTITSQYLTTHKLTNN